MDMDLDADADKEERRKEAAKLCRPANEALCPFKSPHDTPTMDVSAIPARFPQSVPSTRLAASGGGGSHRSGHP
jgi:hypothetical protein